MTDNVPVDTAQTGVLDHAILLASANGHTVNAWQQTTYGMYVARCTVCSLFLCVNVDGVTHGGTTYLKCTPSPLVSENAPTMRSTPLAVDPASMSMATSTTPYNAAHGNERTTCAYCGNGHTLHGVSCAHCSGMNLTEKQRERSKRLARRKTLSIERVPDIDRYLIPDTLTIQLIDTNGTTFFKLATIVHGNGTRYMSPCGVSCAYRVVYMTVPDHATTRELTKQRALYAYPCHMRDCHEYIR